MFTFSGDRKICFPILLLTIAVFLLSGCSTIYRSTYDNAGTALNIYAKEEMTPYLMSTNDIGMACAMGEATSNLLLSFERVTYTPKKTGMSGLFSASLCSQIKAFEAELRHQRALYEGRANEARDAQIQKNRFLRITARRQYKAYKLFKAEYGEPDDDNCPTFDSRSDEFYYLVGLLSGVQSANSDFTSGRSVGVPTDLLTKASRASRCLNSSKWWGVPRALRAVSWTIVPGQTPENKSPWDELEKATNVASKKGVRLAYAFQVLAADNKGKSDLLKETITEAVESRKQTPPPKKHRLLDEVSFLLVKMVSDRLWTENTGHRTPTGKLGTFWASTKKEKESESDENLNKLLPD